MVFTASNVDNAVSLIIVTFKCHTYDYNLKETFALDPEKQQDQY